MAMQPSECGRRIGASASVKILEEVGAAKPN